MQLSITVFSQTHTLFYLVIKRHDWITEGFHLSLVAKTLSGPGEMHALLVRRRDVQPRCWEDRADGSVPQYLGDLGWVLNSLGLVLLVNKKQR